MTKSTYELIKNLKLEISEKETKLFLKPGLHVYNGIQVFYLSLTEHRGGSDHGFIIDTILAKAGGVLSGWCPKELYQKYLPNNTSDDINENKDLVQEMQSGVVIFLLAEFFNTLTIKEQHAVLSHEIAHINLGHRRKNKINLANKDSLSQELKADSRASDEVSKKAMLHALIKLITLQCLHASKSNGKNNTEFKKMLIRKFGNSIISARIEALL